MMDSVWRVPKRQILIVAAIRGREPLAHRSRSSRRASAATAFAIAAVTAGQLRFAIAIFVVIVVWSAADSFGRGNEARPTTEPVVDRPQDSA